MKKWVLVCRHLHKAMMAGDQKKTVHQLELARDAAQKWGSRGRIETSLSYRVLATINGIKLAGSKKGEIRVLREMIKREANLSAVRAVQKNPNWSKKQIVAAIRQVFEAIVAR